VVKLKVEDPVAAFNTGFYEAVDAVEDLAIRHAALFGTRTDMNKFIEKVQKLIPNRYL
jgi:hypothetical protein